ncbi:MAG: hypothetical protein EP338_05965, partial [Bacteroidetes bacterium]
MRKNRDVKFYLEKRKDRSTGELVTRQVQINLFFSHGLGRFQYYTGFRVDTDQWDDERMRVKGRGSEASEINRALDKLRIEVLDAYQKAEVLGIRADNQYFRDALNGEVKVPGKKKSLSRCMEMYIESSAITKTHRTVVHIKSHLKIVQEFSKSTKLDLSFENINMEFYEGFLKYCFEVRGYKNNYTGTIIKTLKAFLNWCTEKGYNTNLEFRKKAFKKLQEEPEIIFL